MKRYKEIALHITNMYNILKTKYSDKYDATRLIYSSGLIYCFTYVHQDLIRVKDLCSAATHSVRLGKCGDIRLGEGGQVLGEVVHIDNQKNYSPNEAEKLTNFIMQVEYLIFNAEPHESYIDIPKAIVFNKKRLQKIIEKTLMQNQVAPSYHTDLEFVEDFMSDDFFNEFKEITGTISIGPERIAEEASQEAYRHFMGNR